MVEGFLLFFLLIFFFHLPYFCQSVEGSGSHKQKKSSTKPKSSALNFDFVNVPENVVWVLTDSSAGSWTPFIGNKEVPESTTQEWAAAFTSVASRKY